MTGPALPNKILGRVGLFVALAITSYGAFLAYLSEIGQRDVIAISLPLAVLAALVFLVQAFG